MRRVDRDLAEAGLCGTEAGRAAEPLGGDGVVVERDGPVGEDLVVLIPLAGDQDAIPRLGHAQRRLDRGAAVGLNLHATWAVKAGEEVVEDLVRVLGPRV